MNKKKTKPKPQQVLQQSVETVEVKRGIGGKYLSGSSGNILGRPVDGKNQLDRLLVAIRKVESEENKNLLQHFVKRGFESDTILIAIFNKIIPNLQSIAVSPDFNQEMSDDMAMQIQKRLKARYGDPPVQEEDEKSETSPLLESETENPT